MYLERLFTPITVNGLTLKNRLVMPAIHHLYTPEGFATDRFKEYYYRKAEGGVGLIIVGGCAFDAYGKTTAMMSLAADEFIPGWQDFTQGIHQRDAKAAVQLYHAGRYTRQQNVPPGDQALSASAVFSAYTRETPKEMTAEEIRRTVELWAAAAARAKKAGFDAVEIIASAGYLICQFLSPVTNLRTDKYGGSWENRTRFPLEVIQAVREAVGPDYPLFMRISGNDFMPGGNTNEKAVEFAKLIENAGIDMINVTGGWHESKVPQITGDLPRGGFSYLAAGVRAGVSVPVMASNRVNDPLLAERMLALGRADLISVGRPLIADPDWVNKAREGRFAEIRKCMACNQGCLSKTFFGKPVECLVNGETGREYLIKEKKPAAAKDILVIGAGPAGCEFAIHAAKRGHQITLWEKSGGIGGQLDMVAAPPGKSEFSALPGYYETMLKKHGVSVVLGKEATAENIPDAGFDTVVIAAGSKPRALKLPGGGAEIPVVSAYDILRRNHIPGKRVVIVGGGSVGCETAQFLAHEGSISPEELYFMMSNKSEKIEKIEALLNTSDYEVTVVEIAERIGAGFDPGTAWPVLADLKRLGVKSLTSAEIISLENGEAVIRQKPKAAGEAETLHRVACDTVVTAVGSLPENGLYAALKDRIPSLYAIGDAREAGKIIAAIRAADELAEQL